MVAVVIVAGWLLLGAVLATIIGRGIRIADERDRLDWMREEAVAIRRAALETSDGAVSSLPRA